MPSVERAAVVTHGVTRNIEGALERLHVAAAAAGVTLELDGDTQQGGAAPDLVIALGGDGTMLRALGRFLASGVPVIGVNLGRVGFLSSIPGAELESGLARVFAGDFAVLELPTLSVALAGRRLSAVNDTVVLSAVPGRIVEISYALDGEQLGSQACDGLICATPQGSTAYNLSNGGPVLVWGLEAAVITLVAPHTLHARPLVVGPAFQLRAENLTPDVDAVVLVDGHPAAALAAGEAVEVRLGEERARLATLPELAFFGRYRRVFGSGV